MVDLFWRKVRFTLHSSSVNKVSFEKQKNKRKPNFILESKLRLNQTILFLDNVEVKVDNVVYVVL